MELNREHSYWAFSPDTKANGSAAGRFIGTGSPALISRSLPMRRIFEHIVQLAGSRLILIEGEAGTGKQFLATHIRGLRASAGDFVVEEAAGLAEADGPAPGGSSLAEAAAQAANGVLFLRNIDELTSYGQMQLLRVVRCLETEAALGMTRPDCIPSQIVCTSRQPLRAKVLAGKFLPELYYRLSAVCFSLPPLRDRKEDLPGLVQVFVDAFSRERRKPLQGLGQGSLAVLLRHRWPGNVRELESVIRAACFAAEGQWIRPIDLSILPLESVHVPAGDPTLPQDLSLDGVLRRHVQGVLKLCSGNKARAAARLGISRSTLYRMLDAEADNALIEEQDLNPSRQSTPNQELAPRETTL